MDPDELRSGSVCVCGEVCLHPGDARKRVRRATPPPGSRYQALPCRQTQWWHVYLIVTEKPSVPVRRKLRRYDAELRRKIEGE
jgi:hypothetical protein